MSGLDEATQHLWNRLQRGEEINDKECFGALLVFKENPSPEVQRVLERFLSHGNELVRLLTFQTLIDGDWAKEEYLTNAKEWLKAPNTELHPYAVAAIALLSNRFDVGSTVPLLVKIAKSRDEPPQARAAAYDAVLGILREPAEKLISLHVQGREDIEQAMDTTMLDRAEAIFGNT